jgi:hypothetical protein
MSLVTPVSDLGEPPAQKAVVGERGVRDGVIGRDTEIGVKLPVDVRFETAPADFGRIRSITFELRDASSGE